MSLKQELTDTVHQVYKGKCNPDTLIGRLIKLKKDFMVRKTHHISTIIFEGVEYVYRTRGTRTISFPCGQLWLFKAVKKDALLFIDRNPNFMFAQKLPTNVTNYEYDDSHGELTGTDINSAYWTIAYNMGIIGKTLFDKCANKKYKVVRLASLAVLGRSFRYQEYKLGEEQKESIVFDFYDVRLKVLYRAIRYECYALMGELAILLGNDFEAYRTDCIYYRDTTQNRILVYKFLDERNFAYKQLVHNNKNKLEDANI